MAATGTSADRPRWWHDEYDTAWTRAKDDIRQKCKECSSTQRNPGLNQRPSSGAAATSGRQTSQGEPTQGMPTSPAGRSQLNQPVPTPEEEERAYRYGYAARLHYGKQYSEWNDELDKKLQEDWPEDWQRSRENIRKGWNYSPDRAVDKSNQPAPSA